MSYNDKHMVECRIKQLRISAYYISYPGVKGSPMISIKKEMLLSEKSTEIRFGCSCPVVVCRQNLNSSI